jgi:DNA gyrase subunit A
MFDKRGSVHTIDVGSIGQDDLTTIGTTLSTYANIAGAPVSVFKRNDITDDTAFVFITKNGIIKKTMSENFAFKNSILSISLKPDDELVNVIAIKEDHDLMIYTKYGVTLRFNTQEVPLTKRMAIGVIALNLSSDDEIIGSREIGKSDKYLVIVTRKGYLKKCELDILISKKRRSEPVAIIPLDGKDSIYTIVTCGPRNTVAVITTRGRYDVRVNDMTSKLKYQPGDKLVPMKKGDVIATVLVQ